MPAFIHLPWLKPKWNIALCHPKLNQVESEVGEAFLPAFNLGQIHDEINLLDLRHSATPVLLLSTPALQRCHQV